MPLSSFASTIRAVVNLQHKIGNSSSLGMEGLTVVDSLTLCVLAETASMSTQDLTRRISIRRNQADRLVVAMQKRGLVSVVAGADQKTSTVALTEAGKQLHESLEGKWDAWIRKNPDCRSALASIRTGVRTMQTSLGAV